MLIKKPLPVHSIKTLAKNSARLQVELPLSEFARVTETLHSFLVDEVSQENILLRERISREANIVHVAIDVRFGQARCGTPILRGHVKFEAPFPCPDCHALYNAFFDLEICLLIAASSDEEVRLNAEKKHYVLVGQEEAPVKGQAVYDRFEVIEVFDVVCCAIENVTLVDLLEDDLILALPIIPKHKKELCAYWAGKLHLLKGDDALELLPDKGEFEELKPNPFKILGKLLQK